MSLPNSKEREAELQAKLDRIGYGDVSHEAISRELLLLKLERLKKTPWYKSPEFWAAAVAALASCLAAYAAFFHFQDSPPYPEATPTIHAAPTHEKP